MSANSHTPLTADDVRRMYRLLLNREVEGADAIARWLSLGLDWEGACRHLMTGEEFAGTTLYDLWSRHQPLAAFAKPGGLRWVVPTHDRIIAPALFRDGQFSLEEFSRFMALAERHITRHPPDGDFADVGANIGTTTLAAAAVDGIRHVHAFEPSRENFVFLKANAALNDLDHKVSATHAAVSSASGTVQIGFSPNNCGDHRVVLPGTTTDFLADTEIERPTAPVPAITLDDYFAERPHRLRYLWIDTQGHEYYVLKGAERLIQAHPDLAIMAEFWPYGARGSGSLPQLCALIADMFTGFIEIGSYLPANDDHPYDTKEIQTLVERLDEHPTVPSADLHTHTNILLVGRR